MAPVVRGAAPAPPPSPTLPHPSDGGEMDKGAAAAKGVEATQAAVKSSEDDEEVGGKRE